MDRSHVGRCMGCNKKLKDEDVINCWECQDWHGCESCYAHHQKVWCPT